MANNTMMNRRDILQQLAIGIAATPVISTGIHANMAHKNKDGMLESMIKHSVCRWCYNDLSLDELCEGAKDIGISSVEIVSPKDWPTLQKYGLTCALGTIPDASIPKGFNRTEHHADLVPKYIDLIDQAADSGIPTVIVFSGNRDGLDDEKGIENCAIGLDKIAKHAEQKNVMVVMELLNSKVNHPDYQCDHTQWGVKLVDKIGSPQFKLLYDIYHMQIMEGDVIATIREYKDYIAHYHTGGVPGRNEIDETQELYYPAIIKAIMDTGYTGYVAQEFIPTWPDKLKALRDGVVRCSV